MTEIHVRAFALTSMITILEQLGKNPGFAFLWQTLSRTTTCSLIETNIIKGNSCVNVNP